MPRPSTAATHRDDDSERHREELERALDGRARMLRDFAHAVKNPLGAAYGYAELLEDGVLGALGHRQRDGARRIRRSLRSALSLIDDLLGRDRAADGGDASPTRTDPDSDSTKAGSFGDSAHSPNANDAQAEDRVTRTIGALRRSDELFRLLIESELIGIVATDPDGRIVVWNRGAERITGRPSETVVGRDLEVLFPEGATERGVPERLLEAAARRTDRVQTRRRLVRADGTPFLADIAVMSLWDGEQRIGYAIGFFDLTEQERAEAARREAEERYRLLAAVTSDVIWDLDVETGRLDWNDAVYTTFRYDPPEVEPSLEWWEDRIHPEDRGRVVASLRAAIEGPGHAWREEYRFRRGDGSYAVVMDRGHVVRDAEGRPTRMVGSMVDVTERVREESRQRLLAEAGEILARSLDVDETIRQLAELLVARIADDCMVDIREPAGKELRRVAVESRDPERKGLLARLRRFPPDTGADPLARELADGRPVLVREVTDEWLRFFARDGKDFELLRALAPKSVMLVPMSARGELFGVLTLMVAQNDRRYDEHDLALAEELALRLALAVDNAGLYEAAIVASQAKSDFLAVMSHELRTPLNAIVGFADLLLLGVPEPLPEADRRHVQRIIESARHLRELIDEILSFSRMEAGKEEVGVEPADLGDILRDAVQAAASQAREKGLEFRVELPDRPLVIETDVDKLRQIVRNIVSNAVKFTDEGRIEVSADVEDGEIVVRVEDTGIGIPPEHREHIFEPFWQVEQGPTRGVGGTGLGLSVSRRLARMLDGDVTVESRVGVGSTFTVRLPARPGERRVAA